MSNLDKWAEYNSRNGNEELQRQQQEIDKMKNAHIQTITISRDSMSATLSTLEPAPILLESPPLIPEDNSLPSWLYSFHSVTIG